MSRFLDARWSQLEPYVPGEQPQGQEFIKLNTNESPFGLTAEMEALAAKNLRALNLYPDPTYRALREALAEMLEAKVARQAGGATGAEAETAGTFRLSPNQVIVSNGSDEVLNWIFGAFCGEGCPAVFPSISYGFYPVFAAMNLVPTHTVPLDDAFCIRVEDYAADAQPAGRKVIVLANPNAPTGIALGLDDIRRIVEANPGNLVVVDEAYVDFGAQSSAALVNDYDNLLVTQTFSKSRSFAGGRLGFGVGNAELIADLEALRNSTNPYNVSNLTVAYGLAILACQAQVDANCAEIARVRSWAAGELRARGFAVLDSQANFLFVETPAVPGGELYARLKEAGVLVRHWDAPRIADWNRITVGTREQMQALLARIDDILREAR